MNVPTDSEETTLQQLPQKEMMNRLQSIPGWTIIHEDSMKKLMRSFTFENFSQVLAFTKLVEKLANKENHHPVLKSSWRKVTIYWWTHAIQGIQEKDFEMAGTCTGLYEKVLTEEDLRG
jgi:4a-hydroxytetrahydrobiopterin dehydratase